MNEYHGGDVRRKMVTFHTRPAPGAQPSAVGESCGRTADVRPRVAPRPAARHSARARVTWTALDQALYSGGSFALAIGVARSVGSTDLAKFALLWAAFWLLAGGQRAFLSEPLLISYETAGDRGPLPARSVGASVIGSGVLALLAGTVAVLVEAPDAVVVFTWSIVALLVQDALRYALICRGDARHAAVVDAAALSPIVVALCFPAGTLTLAVWIAVWSGGALLSCLVGFAFVAFRTEGVRGFLRQHWPLNRNMLGEFLVTSGFGQVGIFLIPLVASYHTLAGLKVAQTVASPLSVAASTATLLMLQPLSRSFARAGLHALRRHAARIAVVLLGLSVAYGVSTLLIPDSLGRRFLGPSWNLGSSAIVLVSLQVAANLASNIASFVLRISHRSGQSFWLRVVTGPISVVGMILGARWGVNQAAGGLLAGSTLAAVLWWTATRSIADDRRPVPPGVVPPPGPPHRPLPTNRPLPANRPRPTKRPSPPQLDPLGRST